MEAKTIQRRYDLDWLRVLAFTGVFFYHCSRFFDESDWHIKNAQTSALVDFFKNLFDLWGMHLIFIISGASIYYALRPGGALRFLRDKIWRLLVPLAFGILVLAPPQIYLEKLTHGLFRGSFWDFLPLYFKDWRIWNGNFAWTGVHLWYLEYLFLFTLVLLPLLAWLKSPAGVRFIDSLAQLTERPGIVFLWMLPPAAWLILLDPFGMIRPTGLSESVARLVVFPPFLLIGFLVYSNERIQGAIIRQRRIALMLAVVSIAIAGIITRLPELKIDLGTYLLLMSMISLLVWSILLAILGYGMRYLTASTRQLSYANEAVLPFYILHQPVILILGYFIIPLDLSILVKYVLIAPLAFGITLGLYEFGVRRVNPVRRIFGLKTLKQDLLVRSYA
jgi:peptidoglycan/LPS O-acetylase OafA/YrhL